MDDIHISWFEGPCGPGDIGKWPQLPHLLWGELTLSIPLKVTKDLSVSEPLNELTCGVITAVLQPLQTPDQEFDYLLAPLGVQVV